MLVGAATFTLGNWFLDQQGRRRTARTPAATKQDGSPLAIVFGSVLDGIPESFVLGLTVLQGGVSVGLLIGVLLSNLPEGMSSSAGCASPAGPAARVVRDVARRRGRRRA